jgi:hypothetical protein
MRIILVIAAIVIFAIAAILAFIGHTSIRDVIGLVAIGLACYAAVALPIPDRVP